MSAHESEGVPVVLEPGGENDRPDVRRPMRLELLAADRPGIVRQVADALAVMEISVEALESERLEAPMCGEALFRARLRLRVPEGLGDEDLRHALEALADDLMVELAADPRAAHLRGPHGA
ncbi:MAG: hypothetical protein GWN53_18490 [Gammaproteobacteria bacterium]|nr:hypothetical protein [Gammaproteobacteria bacterium]